MKFVSKIVNRAWFYPLVLLLVGGVAYGLLIPRLGFYWDDWESVYLYHLHNPSISFQYYAERPFSALSYLLFFPFARMTPVVWQSLALLLRWGATLLFYFTLNAVWPQRVSQNRWIGALLLVFPGFLLQPASTAFNQHLTVFVLFTGSLLMTVMAIKHRKYFWLWMPLSFVTGMLQIFMMEYFVGLEVIRPVLIWFALRLYSQEDKPRHLLKTLLYWLPFLIGLGIYAGWRFIYLPTSLPSDPNAPLLLKSILSSPINGLTTLIEKAVQDIIYLFASAWVKVYTPEFTNWHSKLSWIAWSIAIPAAALFGFYAFKTSADKETLEKRGFMQMLFLGCLALAAGAAPVWAKGSQMSVGKWSDRFALAPMIGAVILIVSVIDWLIRTRAQKQWLYAILLASSLTLQISNCMAFRLDWEQQRNLYWQLAWRMPGLEPGTAVIGSGAFSEKSSPYDGMYIINLLYDKNVSANPRYGYLDVGHFLPYNYRADVPISSSLRGGQFSGNTSQAIGIYFDTKGGCARVLDSIYSGDPGFSDDINSLIAISHPSQIITSGPALTPDPAIFGNEVTHGWCYYFERADLARQVQDWGTVLQLGSAASTQGFTPKEGAEYLPFIEAYVQTGQWARAFELSVTAQAIAPDLNLKPLLCTNWNRFSKIAGGSDRETSLAQANSTFCGSTVK